MAVSRLDRLLDNPRFPYVAAVLVGVAVAMALWPTLSKLFNRFANYYFESSAARKAMHLRRDGQQVRVRQTDLVARMTGDDRATFRRAEALLARGQVVEAAAAFESIKFQRRAIDELEKAGLIDEACAVLLRMNVPGRAAVLYERNGKLEKAVHYYDAARQFENAAKVHLRLAARDWGHFDKAAAAYALANKAEEAVRVYGMALTTPRVLAITLEKGLFDALAQYMADSVTALEAGQRLSEADWDRLITGLSEHPRTARLLAGWVSQPQLRPRILTTALVKAGSRDELASAFWRALAEADRAPVLAALSAMTLSPEARARHQIATTSALRTH